MSNPLALQLPTTRPSGWMPTLDSKLGTCYRLVNDELYEDFNGSGYPTQTSAGTSSGNDVTATVATAQGKFEHLTSTHYKVTGRNGTGNDKLYKSISDVNPTGTDFVMRVGPVNIDSSSDNGSLHMPLWIGNSARNNNINSLGVAFLLQAGGTLDVRAWSFAGAGALTQVDVYRDIPLDTDYWVELSVQNNWAYMRLYLDEYNEIYSYTKTENIGLVVPNATMNIFGCANWNASGAPWNAGDLIYTADNWIVDALPYTYPTSQPEVSLRQIATAGTIDMSTLSLDYEANKELAYSVDAGAYSAWLTPGNFRAESDQTVSSTFDVKLRTTLTDGATADYVTGGNVDAAVVMPPAPGAPNITAYTVGDGSITITIDGDALMVNEMYYRVTGGAPLSGGTRNGDGDITKTGLVNGTIYEVFAQSYNIITYGPASSPIYVMPLAATATPNTAIASFLEKLRYVYANSSNLLSWIQSVDITETTDRHVVLGMDPRTAKDVKTKGPIVAINLSDFNFNNIGSPINYMGKVSVTINHFWYEDQRSSAQTRIEQVNYIDSLITELMNIGIPFDATHSGQLDRLQAQVMIYDPKRPEIKVLQMRASITFGNS